jgi:hypothetical protein
VARIRVSTEIDAPPVEVWDDIGRIESHVEWMHDAVAIRFLGEQRHEVGVTFECDTKVGWIRLTDRMEITEWVDQWAMGVRHTGVVAGEGRFTLEPLGDNRTRFTWEETLGFPWWMGGPVGAAVGAIVLRMVWRRNLRNLATRFVTPPLD